MAENPPANAGDTGSSPGEGRSHLPRSSSAPGPHLLSLSFKRLGATSASPCAATTEARAEPALHKRSLCPALEEPLLAAAKDESAQNGDPAQLKVNK